MLEFAATAPFALDLLTLIVVATCVTALLGFFLLLAWIQDRVRALAWWGAAYLIGGISVALWGVESAISPSLPQGTANAFIFVACGMIWNAARQFHGRHVLWGAMVTGATIWLLACMSETFVASLGARIILSSLIIASYTFLTAAELWCERRKHLVSRWPAVFVPMLHGAVFLFPIPLASLLPAERGMLTLASGWVAVFVLEIMLYVVGTAFIVLVLSKERAVRLYKAAALTDPMTGLFNRRGFIEASHELMAKQAKSGMFVSILMFDLDRFKSINDSYGHAVGDEALRLFAQTAIRSMRASDVLARFGGEEFVAMLPGTIEEAVVAADRVRQAFQAEAVQVGAHKIGATVSIGVASASARKDIDALIGEADAALYRAKLNGRNRVEHSLPNDCGLSATVVPMRAAA